MTKQDRNTDDHESEDLPPLNEGEEKSPFYDTSEELDLSAVDGGTHLSAMVAEMQKTFDRLLNENEPGGNND